MKGANTNIMAIAIANMNTAAKEVYVNVPASETFITIVN